MRSRTAAAAVTSAAAAVPVPPEPLVKEKQGEEETKQQEQQAEQGLRVEEAPAFYPTAEEFADPLSYIAKIRPLAEYAGAARIIPPEGWVPPFTIDSASFKFPTRVQNLSRLGASARLSRDFDKLLRKFLFKRGTPLAGPLQLEKQQPPLDLYSLYKAVKGQRYGFDAVTYNQQWEAVAVQVGLRADQAKRLKNEYKEIMLPFEKWQANRVAQQQQQASTSTTTPATPTAAASTTTALTSSTTTTTTTTSAPIKTEQEEEPAVDSLHKQTRSRSGKAPFDLPTSETTEYAKLLDNGTKKTTTLPNHGKFIGRSFWRYVPDKEIYLRGTITSFEKGRGFHIKYFEEEEAMVQEKLAAKKAKEMAAAAAIAAAAAAAAAAAGEIVQAQPMTIAAPAKGRGSASAKAATGKGRGRGRDKKDAGPRYFVEILARREMLILLANGDSKAAARAIQSKSFCESCLRTSVHGPMTECFSCGALRHAPCMEPPQKHLPYGDWFCPDCVKEPEVTFGTSSTTHASCRSPSKPRKPASSTHHHQQQQHAGRIGPIAKAPPVEELFASFGFQDGDDYTLDSYEEMASEWRDEYFQRNLGRTDVSLDEIEAEFWRIMNGGEVIRDGEDKEPPVKGRSRAPGEVKVEYGSEIDTGVHGSAFPLPAALRAATPGAQKSAAAHLAEHMSAREKEKMRSYERSGWNINNLPVATGSMLHHLDVPVTGVVVPWLYVGMSLSAFCWHAEDHYLYSINYLHKGRGPKGWYAVPGAHADAFEALVQELFPELFERNPDLMLQLVTMVDPKLMVSRGIPVYRTRQQVGQFVITFPQAYHAGFNFDFNVAEAVNFAPPDFLPWGGKAQELYRRLHRSPVFSQDQLVVAAAKALLSKPPRETAECLPFVRGELERMIRDTQRRMAAARELGIVRFEEGAKELCLNLEEEEEEGKEEVKEEGGGADPGIGATLRERKGAKVMQQSPSSSSSQSPAARGRKPGKMGGGVGRMGGMRAPARQEDGQVIRHGLLKGPRCAVCQQYCFLEQIHCGGCSESAHQRAVCAEHASEACLNGCSPAAFVYRQRCPEGIMKSFAEGLQKRATALDAWRRELATCPLTLAALEKEEEVIQASMTTTTTHTHTHTQTGSKKKQKQQQQKQEQEATVESKNGDDSVDGLLHRLSESATTIGTLLSDAQGWQGRPSYAHLLELHKLGKELGAPRHEYLVLDKAIKAIRVVVDRIVAILPEGVTKQGHMRLKPVRATPFSNQKRRPLPGEKEEEVKTLDLEALVNLIVFILHYPIRLEKEAIAALRLLGEVTRLRKGAWELLGLVQGETFKALDLCLSRAEQFVPQSVRENVLEGPKVQLEGAPQFFPQGLDPNKKQFVDPSLMVQGKWEGHSFCFFPGHDLWWAVGQTRNSLNLLSVEVPEFSLLEKGKLVRSEQEQEREDVGVDVAVAVAETEATSVVVEEAKAGEEEVAVVVPMAIVAAVAEEKAKRKPMPSAKIIAASNNAAAAAASKRQKV